MAMRRTELSTAVAGGAKLVDEVFQGFYPTLFEWMTETQWEDGKARKTSTLLLFVENGRWKAHLNDRDNRRGFWASAESQEWLLESVEKTLLDGSAEWKKDTR